VGLKNVTKLGIREQAKRKKSRLVRTVSKSNQQSDKNTYDVGAMAIMQTGARTGSVTMQRLQKY
jgi:hypothetical protein